MKQKKSKEIQDLQKKIKKNYLKEKYKIFTNKYDEIKNAEELENEKKLLDLEKI